MKVKKECKVTLEVTNDEYFTIKAMCDCILSHCNNPDIKSYFDSDDLNVINDMFLAMSDD